MRAGSASAAIVSVAAFALAAIPAASPRVTAFDAAQTPAAGSRLEQPSVSDAGSLANLIREAFALTERGELDAARQRFEQALAAAVETRDIRSEADAHRGLALVHSRRGESAETRIALEKALGLYEAAGARTGVGLVASLLGDAAYAGRELALAREYYQRALVAYDAVGDRRQKATALYNLTFVTTSFDEREQLIRSGLDLAREVGDLELEGTLLHSWGDAYFLQGELSAAMAKLEEASLRLEKAGPAARGSLARVLTSAGRVHRAHGDLDQALSYYGRALAIQQEIGDKAGVVQSVNAQGITYGYMGRRREQVDHLQRALALARETGPPGLINFQLGNLGGALVGAGEYARGAEMLEQLVRDDSGSWDEAHRYSALSHAYLELGRNTLALDAAQTAVARARSTENLEFLPYPLYQRAIVRKRLGFAADALADAQEAIEAISRRLARLVPSDTMKQAFGDQFQTLFTLTIDLLHQLGRHREALETAEQARARAFVDLLATREVQLKPDDRAELAELRRIQDTLGGAPRAARNDAVELTLRGDEARSVSLHERWDRADPELRSFVAAPPLAAEEIEGTAERLRSTVLSYWVGDEATFIWVAAPGAPIRAARVNVSSRRLTELVRETWSVKVAGSDRGDSPAADRDASASSADSWAWPIRGADLAVAAGDARSACRELFRLLIQPVRSALPSAADSLLTIVPHGPLFLLSFAALVDERDRYLIETYRLHYVPSGAVLQFTGRNKQRTASPNPHYLLVADPSQLPDLPNGRRLPALPGSRREVTAVAALLSANQATVLTGPRAREQVVRELAPRQTVLHFATHGVIRDDQPLDSFLAFGVVPSAPARPSPNDSGALASDRTPPRSQADDDGRLTAQEIYGLDLDADLVVLSACRSALGKVSGDGLIGLVRGFMYAGAPSVVATLWDVADEPASLLMPQFYRALSQRQDKSRALRTAQLRLLQSLRRGEVKVATRSGSMVALREHPMLWASFVLMGEP